MFLPIKLVNLCFSLTKIGAYSPHRLAQVKGGGILSPPPKFSKGKPCLLCVVYLSRHNRQLSSISINWVCSKLRIFRLTYSATIITDRNHLKIILLKWYNIVQKICNVLKNCSFLRIIPWFDSYLVERKKSLFRNSDHILIGRS